MESDLQRCLLDLMICDKQVLRMLDPAHVQKFDEREIRAAVKQLSDIIFTELSLSATSCRLRR